MEESIRISSPRTRIPSTDNHRLLDRSESPEPRGVEAAIGSPERITLGVTEHAGIPNPALPDQTLGGEPPQNRHPLLGQLLHTINEDEDASRLERLTATMNLVTAKGAPAVQSQPVAAEFYVRARSLLHTRMSLGPTSLAERKAWLSKWIDRKMALHAAKSRGQGRLPPLFADGLARRTLNIVAQLDQVESQLVNEKLSALAAAPAGSDAVALLQLDRYPAVGELRDRIDWVETRRSQMHLALFKNPTSRDRERIETGSNDLKIMIEDAIERHQKVLG